MRTLKILFLIAGLTLLAAAPALAHTELVSKSPEEGATLKQAPGQVRISFSGPVEAEFSPLEVYDAQDRRVDKNDARLDSGDATTITVGLREGLPAGSYTVEYRFTGDDGHTITGSYEFAVTEQSAPAEPTTEETTAAPRNVSGEGTDPAAEETTLEGAEQSASGESGLANMALYVGLAIVGLAIIGMLVMRRR